MTHYLTIEELQAAVGGETQKSEWTEITQERVNQFADATGDHQWIHVDVERAKAGPFGGPIAHGYLTLSMVSQLLGPVVTFEGTQLVINYGLEKVRFLSPVPVGSRIRATSQIASVMPASQGVRVNSAVTVEIEGNEKPALVAETILLFVLGA